MTSAVLMTSAAFEAKIGLYGNYEIIITIVILLQEKYRSQFFSLFYFSINLGALSSKWLTPVFRADLDCYPGHDDPLFRECYSVAFGVPGCLMLVALSKFCKSGQRVIVASNFSFSLRF